MEILHVSAECYPMAKVGGLGDVVGALPKYLNHLGATASVIMPAYRTKFFNQAEWKTVHQGTIHLIYEPVHYKVLKEKNETLGFTLYAIDIYNMLDTPVPYGYANDAERFIAFQLAVLSWVNCLDKKPDVLHCHDHHTGFIPFMIDYAYLFQELQDVPAVFTIHSAQYQGWLAWDRANLLPAFDPYKRGMLEWDSLINPMASAIKCAWKFTTVSPGYLEELYADANGIEELIRNEKEKGSGILNGIDAEIWDPETDEMIATNYSAENVDEGKKENKKSLCETFDLDADKPLIAFIGRLVPEKGADVLAESITQSLNEHKGQLNFLVLGSGNTDLENSLQGLLPAWKGNFNCYIGYHEKLSHLIYAGSDFLLMPSRVEPCGLNQLYALRYGTIPIVRSTGGLKDTVIDFEEEGGFGIRFDQPMVKDICYSVDRAVGLFADQEKIISLQKLIMGFDHSWNASAKHYLDLYESLKSE